eukprot:8237990-Ditylum_brightwellii.AAC.1
MGDRDSEGETVVISVGNGVTVIIVGVAVGDSVGVSVDGDINGTLVGDEVKVTLVGANAVGAIELVVVGLW